MRRILFLWVVASLVVGCKSSDEDAEGGAASAEWPPDEACALLTEEVVREVFELGADVELKRKEDVPVSFCGYEWAEGRVELGGVELDWRTFDVSLNFGPTFPSRERADAAWEQQNRSTAYADRELEEVSGVGDRASWSDLAGGQLRILHRNGLMYVNHSYREARMEQSNPGFPPTPGFPLSSYEGQREKTVRLAEALLAR